MCVGRHVCGCVYVCLYVDLPVLVTSDVIQLIQWSNIIMLFVRFFNTESVFDSRVIVIPIEMLLQILYMNLTLGWNWLFLW